MFSASCLSASLTNLKNRNHDRGGEPSIFVAGLFRFFTILWEVWLERNDEIFRCVERSWEEHQELNSIHLFERSLIRFFEITNLAYFFGLGSIFLGSMLRFLLWTDFLYAFVHSFIFLMKAWFLIKIIIKKIVTMMRLFRYEIDLY